MKSKGPIVYNDVPGNLVQVGLTGSVGYGGENDRDDVKCIQSLLNIYNEADKSRIPLTVDGVVGPRTNDTICAFQRKIVGFVDQRIDPGGKTIRALVKATLSNRSTLPLVPRVGQPDASFVAMYRELPRLTASIPRPPILGGSNLAIGGTAPNDWFDTPLTGWDVVTSGATDVGASIFGGIRGTIVIRNETDNSQYRLTYYAVGVGVSATPIGLDFSDESMKSYGSRVFKGVLGNYPFPVKDFAPNITLVTLGANIGPGWGVGHACFNGFVICKARCWLTGFQAGMPGASVNIYTGWVTVTPVS